MSDYKDDRILHTLRMSAWERAKAELNTMLHTYYGGDEQFKIITKLHNEFMKKVEDYL